jgi:hypothetical protein
MMASSGSSAPSTWGHDCRVSGPDGIAGRAAAATFAAVPATPLTTPSNRARTDLRPPVASAASTRCSSVVPGLANKVLTPDSTSVRISARGPSIAFVLSS